MLWAAAYSSASLTEEKKVEIVKVKNSVQQHSVDANVNISIEKEELETEEGKNDGENKE